MRGSARVVLAVLCLGVSFSLFAQERPPAEPLAEAVAGADSLEAQPRPTEEEEAALAAANGAIRRRLAARNKPLPAGSSVEAIGVSRRSSDESALLFRYRIDWVEWSHAELLPATTADFAAGSATAAAAIDLAPLDVNILARADADRIVKACHARLSAIVHPLRPPFRHRLTNVYWNAEAGAPFLQSSTRIPGTENDCVRADLNLVTGESTCRDMACAVR